MDHAYGTQQIDDKTLAKRTKKNLSANKCYIVQSEKRENPMIAAAGRRDCDSQTT